MIMMVNNRLDKAIRFLNSRCFTVLFSGGKDSLASLLWVLDNVKHDNWNILYIEITGNTHTLCNEYVYNVIRGLGLEDKFVHAKREDLDFFECLKKWGIPLIGVYRWCMWQFKVKVLEKYSYITQVTGIKQSDSYRRRNVKLIDIVKATRNIIVNPIIEWTTDDVIDYIKEHGVPLNPCYDVLGHSGNCVFCPYHNKRQIFLTLQDPEWRGKILDTIRYNKGPIGKRIANQWFKLSRQTTIAIR